MWLIVTLNLSPGETVLFEGDTEIDVANDFTVPKNMNTKLNIIINFNLLFKFIINLPYKTIGIPSII